MQQGSKFPKDIVPAANFGDENLLHVCSPGEGFSAAIRCARFHNGTIYLSMILPFIQEQQIESFTIQSLKQQSYILDILRKEE